MEIAAIIQARMGSRRLPGKVLKEVLEKPLLQLQIERVSRSKFLNSLMVATTNNDEDGKIVDLCRKLSVPYYCGAETDVLSRYYYAARNAKADIIVRLTGDCPLLDPQVIDRVIREFLNFYPQADYVSNTLVRTFPRGMDTSVISFSALEEAFLKARNPQDREHVTSFIYLNPQQFKLKNVCYHQDVSRYRLTVDTAEDFSLIKRIIEGLYGVKPWFTLEDIINFLAAHPRLSEINAHVEQGELR
ncbi:MAG: cytidylyltransferase domain-containing protein [Peptococcaceae bacterium]